MGAALMVRVLGELAAHPAVAQVADGVTYATKVDKAETRLDFGGSAEQAERQVRAFNPPGAWFEYDGERIRVLAATSLTDASNEAAAGTVIDDALTIACGTGAIRPTLVQRAGRGVMTTADLLRGFPIPPGTRL